MDRLQEQRLGEPLHRLTPDPGRQCRWQIECEPTDDVAFGDRLLPPDRGEFAEDAPARPGRGSQQLGVAEHRLRAGVGQEQVDVHARGRGEGSSRTGERSRSVAGPLHGIGSTEDRGHASRGQDVDRVLVESEPGGSCDGGIGPLLQDPFERLIAQSPLVLEMRPEASGKERRESRSRERHGVHAHPRARDDRSQTVQDLGRDAGDLVGLLDGPPHRSARIRRPPVAAGRERRGTRSGRTRPGISAPSRRSAIASTWATMPSLASRVASNPASIMIPSGEKATGVAISVHHEKSTRRCGFLAMWIAAVVMAAIS